MSFKKVLMVYNESALKTAQSILNKLRSNKGNDHEKIEIPPEQYSEVMEILNKQVDLKDESVKGTYNVKDPKQALGKIVPGELSFTQVSNIAKAGNLDSITFDIKTNAVHCSCGLGASLAIGIALSLWRGQSFNDALKSNFKNSLGSSMSTLIMSVGTNQLLRTALSQVGANYSNRMLCALYQTSLGRQAIDNFVKFSSGNALHGSAAINQMSSVLRSNIIASICATTVLTAPDLYRAAIKKSMSWQQFSKNFAINSISIVSGSAGWVLGASAGATIGSVFPIVGTGIGGVVGGLAGSVCLGAGSGKITKILLDKIRPDDQKIMFDLCKNVCAKIANDYLLSNEEATKLVNYMAANINPKFLRNMYRSGKTNQEREQWCYLYFDRYAFDLVYQRPPIHLPNDQTLDNIIDNYMDRCLLSLSQDRAA